MIGLSGVLDDGHGRAMMPVGVIEYEYDHEHDNQYE